MTVYNTKWCWRPFWQLLMEYLTSRPLLMAAASIGESPLLHFNDCSQEGEILRNAFVILPCKTWLLRTEGERGYIILLNQTNQPCNSIVWSSQRPFSEAYLGVGKTVFRQGHRPRERGTTNFYQTMGVYDAYVCGNVPPLSQRDQMWEKLAILAPWAKGMWIFLLWTILSTWVV